MARTLSPTEAQAFYDRFGSRQDKQGWYENPALEALIAHARFDEARDVLEIGCGTGRFALRLLSGVLPSDCRYVGLDISTTMVELARTRLAAWGDRARVVQGDATAGLAAAGGPFDRVVSTYVFDILAPAEIDAVLAGIERVLAPAGLVGLVGLGPGRGPAARLVSRLWAAVHAVNPNWTGGCRPLRLGERIAGRGWRTVWTGTVAPYGIASDVIVAAPKG